MQAVRVLDEINSANAGWAPASMCEQRSEFTDIAGSLLQYVIDSCVAEYQSIQHFGLAILSRS